jgi:hypothetical protein
MLSAGGVAPRPALPAASRIDVRPQAQLQLLALNRGRPGSGSDDQRRIGQVHGDRRRRARELFHQRVVTATNLFERRRDRRHQLVSTF